jgi:hypothetical protein
MKIAPRADGAAAAQYVSPTGQTAMIDTGFPGARDLERIMAAIGDAGVKQIDYLHREYRRYPDDSRCTDRAAGRTRPRRGDATYAGVLAEG